MQISTINNKLLLSIFIFLCEHINEASNDSIAFEKKPLEAFWGKNNRRRKFCSYLVDLKFFNFMFN